MINRTSIIAGALLIPNLVLATPPNQKTPVISEKTAVQMALAAVPSGVVKSSELETEHGRLIYSFDIVVPGKTGIEEVHVSAATGRIIARQHEGPRKERAESMIEQREHKAH
ncbi:MAG: PepSY domain-containing protein [Gammaproteobacteria bacterium]|nr:PepSY domain-containing protein [Gammaproteobacteria bacterium]